MMENDKLQEINNKNNLRLAPETMRIRDAIIEKYSEIPLDTLSSKLQSLINDDTDTGTKLGIFSARVEILRMRFSEIADKKYVKERKVEDEQDSVGEDEILDQNDDIKEGWMTLKILEASEVNGVRFPEGVKIDVHAEDAKKLLESKKAELISLKIEDVIEKVPEDTQNIEEAAEATPADEEGSDPKENIAEGNTKEKAEEGSSLNPEEMEMIESIKTLESDTSRTINNKIDENKK